jgi:hypothetical protein
MCPSEASKSCPWCGVSFTPRPKPGTSKVFCSDACRLEVHTAARHYTARLLAEGFISIANLKEASARAKAKAAAMKEPEA